MDEYFKGKVALVTGARAGIGLGRRRSQMPARR
jgi:NADP-dependent 3-hydroxy acid dehydrogenase YdfG